MPTRGFFENRKNHGFHLNYLTISWENYRFIQYDIDLH